MTTTPSEKVDIEKAADAPALNEVSNSEGTAHQDALGPKAKSGLFTPLDQDYANAVQEDAKSVVFSPEEDVR